VPFRRFRVWLRLRRAIGEIIGGSTFTDAAYAAGFADQAHFSRAFRQAFGASASPSLRKVRRAAV
jgi:AraC-like DNA-binding protein